jgi:hypothetical protein
MFNWKAQRTATLPDTRIVEQGNLQISIDNKYNLATKDYYEYCASLLLKESSFVRNKFNLILGDHDEHFANKGPTFRVGLQTEHTLVKPGGRDSKNAPQGSIPIDACEMKYLVRLDSYKKLRRMDAILDYSRANIVNIKRSSHYKDIQAKIHHIFPLIYDKPCFSNQDRDIECITMFGSLEEKRRKMFLEQCDQRIEVRNISGIYSSIDKHYSRVKVLLNIHQTDYHDTAEMLRIIPAMMNGVIVISETSPLLEEAFIKNLAIWSPIEQIPDVAQKTIENYKEIHRALFSKKLLTRLERLSKYNKLVCQKVLASLDQKASIAN